MPVPVDRTAPAGKSCARTSGTPSARLRATRFAEQGNPEEVMEILNAYLARMAELVIANGGTINEFIGDAIFAVYGAPVAHPDHA